jgi:hypothetical protein
MLLKSGRDLLREVPKELRRGHDIDAVYARPVAANIEALVEHKDHVERISVPEGCLIEGLFGRR